MPRRKLDDGPPPILCGTAKMSGLFEADNSDGLAIQITEVVDNRSLIELDFGSKSPG